METKVCSRCARILPADNCHFYPASNTKDKLHSACKECEGHKFSKPKAVAKEGYKICIGCYKEYPATKEYYFVNTGKKSSKCGLSPKCKQCSGHKFMIIELNKPLDGYKICNTCRENLPYTTEFYYSNGNKTLEGECKKCALARDHKHYYANQEKKQLYAREWHNKNYRNDETRKIQNRVKVKEWRIANQDTERYKEVQRQKSQKRRSIKEALPATFTKEQWLQCKEYFENTCAYCGKTHKRLDQEHFIPLVKLGPYTKENIISACRSCNSSKKDLDFFEWYPRQPFYSKEREQKILEYLNISTP